MSSETTTKKTSAVKHTKKSASKSVSKSSTNSFDDIVKFLNKIKYKFPLLDNKHAFLKYYTTFDENDKWGIENYDYSHIERNNENWGILCGKHNNIEILDLDVIKPEKDSIDKKCGVEWFRENIGEIEDQNTFIVKTPSGGYHLYYQACGEYVSQAQIMKGIKIDWRGNDAGYVCIGKEYKIIKNMEPAVFPKEIKEKIGKQIMSEQKKTKSSNITIQKIFEENIYQEKEDTKQIETDENIKEEDMINSDKRSKNYTYIMSIIKDVFKSIEQKCQHHNFNSISDIKKHKNYDHIYIVTLKTKYCIKANRSHTNANLYYVIDLKKNIIYQKCFSANCINSPIITQAFDKTLDTNDDEYIAWKKQFEAFFFKIHTEKTVVVAGDKHHHSGLVLFDNFVQFTNYIFLNKNFVHLSKKQYLNTWFCEDKTALTYEKIDYIPYTLKNPENNLIKEASKMGKLYNTYKPIIIKENLEIDDKYNYIVNSFNKLISHLTNNIDKHSKYLLTYIAHILQYPEIKPKVCIVFCGESGSGKGTLFRILGKIFGQHFFQTSDIENDVLGRFNALISKKLLICLDDIDKDAIKKNGKLRSQISEPTLKIEQKSEKSYIENRADRYMISTNYGSGIIEILPSDRRIVMFDTNTITNDELKETFDDILSEDGIEILKHYLSDYKVDLFTEADFQNDDIRPMTKKYYQNKAAEIPLAFKFIYDLVMNPREYCDYVEELAVKEKKDKYKCRINVELNKDVSIELCNDSLLKCYKKYNSDSKVNSTNWLSLELKGVPENAIVESRKNNMRYKTYNFEILLKYMKDKRYNVEDL